MSLLTKVTLQVSATQSRGFARHAEGILLENIGESGQEPLSGVQGKGTVTEPYDQGNAGGESDNASFP